MPYILFDIAILLILALFAWRGAAKGFVLSFCGLLAVIVAFVGSSTLASNFSPKVADALEPKFAAAIEERLQEQISQTGAPALPGAEGSGQTGEFPLQDVLNVLKDMGFYEDLIGSVDKAVTDGMMDAAAGAAAAVAASVAQSVAYLVIFLAAFVLIMLVWTLLAHALDLVTRLPGLNMLNKTAGALVGLVKACVVLFLAAWAVRFMGNLIPEEAIRQTTLLNFFMNTNPMTLLTGI